MSSRARSFVLRLLGSITLLLAVAGAAFVLLKQKRGLEAAAAAAAAAQPEPAWSIEAAPARVQRHARTTTAIGTVRALQSITLRNELPGTVRAVAMQSGAIAEAGALLVELDVAVEQAELAALEAEAALAATMLARMEQALQQQGASAADVDRAKAQRDMAVANVERTRAIIERKRIRAPFRARVGMVDLHVGQYLDPGTAITTLQGLDEAVHVDFAVPQDVAARLGVGDLVEVSDGVKAMAKARIVAIDSRVEAATRNAWIRALFSGPGMLPQPGAALRVRVPVEREHDVIVVPVSALRRGPGGDHVFVVGPSPDGRLRAQQRRVAAGAVLGDDVVLREGVVPGERVATTGSFKLYDGALVAITEGTAPNGPQ